MLTLDLENRWYLGRWLLPAMLWPLHGALLCGVESQWMQPLLFVHLGLFLLWQPLWRSDSKAGWWTSLFLVLAVMVVQFCLSWWVIAVWLTCLFGLVGACVFDLRDRWSRLLYLAVMAYLLTALLLWVTPNLLDVQHAIEVGRFLLTYVLTTLLAMFALSLLKRVSPLGCISADGVQSVNYICSLLLLVLLIMVVLGSIAFMALAQLTYPEALLHMLFLAGFGLLGLGALCKPWFGFNGLQLMLSRYQLQAGAPLESWLGRLAETAEREPDAAAYLRCATILLAEIPWLTGLAWQSDEGSGQIGYAGKHEVSVQEGGLQLKLYASKPPDLGALLQVCLVAQLTACFYQIKLRAQEASGLTPAQAEHETGASFTLDLKNILQSLISLSDLAQSHDEQARLLLQHQIPQLVRSLELALQQLKTPPA